MYTLHSPWAPPLTNSAPVKSTPVTSKGKDYCTWAFTSGGGSGAVYGRLASFLQTTHFLSTALHVAPNTFNRAQLVSLNGVAPCGYAR